jgi:hypothetical protein
MRRFFSILTTKRIVTLFLTAVYSSVSGQVDFEKKYLYHLDPLVKSLNIYELKSGSLFKAIPLQESCQGQFNSDFSKYYLAGSKQYAYVVDCKTLSCEKLKLVADKDTVDPIANKEELELIKRTTKKKETSQIESTANETKKSIEVNAALNELNTLLSDNSENFDDAKYAKAAANQAIYFICKGISENGLVLYEKYRPIFGDQVEYTLFDLTKGGKKILSFLESKNGHLIGENLFFIDKKGSLKIINPITKAMVLRKDNFIASSILSDIQSNGIDPGFSIYSTSENVFSFNTVFFNKKINAVEYYTLFTDKNFTKLLDKRTTNAFDGLNVFNEKNSFYYLKKERIDKNQIEPKLVQIPIPDLDIANKKPKEVEKAVKEIELISEKNQQAIRDYQTQTQAYWNPKNFKMAVYRDASFENELFSYIDSQGLSISNNLVFVMKERQLEIYDLQTKELIQIILLI